MDIDVAPIAQDKMRDFLAVRGEGLGIRIGYKTTGCSGYAYTIEFADVINSDDIKKDFPGVMLVIDPKAKLMLQGITIDHQTIGLNSGFEFINPLEKARCGCGESFTV